MAAARAYTDTELLEILQSDAELALTALHARFWKPLYLAAFSVIKDAAACEDIVQDVLLSLWIRRREQHITSLPSYLFTAVRYRVLTYVKAAPQRKVFVAADELEKLAGMAPASHRLDEQDIMELLNQGIAALPDRCREIFILSRRQHLSNREIAERMGISIKTVEAQITIALKQLKMNLGEFLFWILVATAFIRP